MKLLDEFIERNKIAQYENVHEFMDSFSTPLHLPFEGMGSFWVSGVSQDFLVIDKDVILFMRDKNDYLKGIFRLDYGVVSSQEFYDGVQTGAVMYKDFNLELESEVKIYEHPEETEIIITPSGRIDQLKRISLYISGDGVKYRAFEYASLEEVLKAERIKQLLDKRLEELLEKKRKKKLEQEGN